MTAPERAAARVYEQLLTRVGEASPRPRIEPVRRLAELAGSPQLSFPVIQVAGTNGKTSTSRAIEALLRAHGLRTGLFTSPHLVDFSERFQVDGRPVGGHELAEAWEELQLPLQIVDAELAAAGNGPITFSEALAVLGFAIFADAPVEVAVIEVGMGGEWDATYVADAEVAVFSPIDLDHVAILGPDIESIARTKAGIIKPGATVVSAAQQPEALAELAEAALGQAGRLSPLQPGATMQQSVADEVAARVAAAADRVSTAGAGVNEPGTPAASRALRDDRRAPPPARAARGSRERNGAEANSGRPAVEYLRGAPQP